MAQEKLRCPSCQAPVYPTDNVCMSCGAELRGAAASSAAAEPAASSPAGPAPASPTGPAAPPAGAPPPAAPGAVPPAQVAPAPEKLYWAGQQEESEWYTQEELEEAERRETTRLNLGKAACCIAWGVGAYFLFAIFAAVGGMFFALAPLLAILIPLVYLVLFDGQEWMATNPKLMIPIAIVGACFSAGMFVWALKFGLFEK